MDLVSVILMILALGSTVIVKYAATVRTIRQRERLVEVESELRNQRGKLKAAQNQKDVMRRELRKTERQKEALDKKTKHAENELTSLNR